MPRKQHNNAVAPESCWRCRRAGTVCDRKRPRCGACLKSGALCPGYRMQLTWTNSIATRGNNKGRDCPRRVGTAQLADQSAFSRISVDVFGLNPSDLPRDWHAGLVSYDKVFCAIPVTTDFDLNPFRRAIKLGFHTPSIMHAILAFSFKQMQETDQAERHKALSLRSKSGVSLEDPEAAITAVLLYMIMRYADSAYGEWEFYIKHANTALERAVDTDLIANIEILSQMCLILWFDVCLSMFSRNSFSIAQSVYANFFRHAVVPSDFDCFSIVGMDSELFELYHDVVSLAVCYASSPSWELLDSASQYSERLLCWVVPEEFGPDRLRYLNEVQFNYTVRRLSCMQAWRWCILLYIELAFHPGATRLIDYYSDLVMKHIRDIPQDDMIQKQVLIPIMLANLSARDPEQREFAIGYCNHWYRATKFGMFNSAKDVLRQTWHSSDTCDLTAFQSLESLRSSQMSILLG